MKVVGFLAAFGVAIWSLATGWAAFRATWAQPTLVSYSATLGYAAVFAASFLVLGFWLYSADRAAGRVQRRIGLYEWILRRER